MNKERYFIFLAFATGLLILVFPLFSKGMFMDGTIYAAVASNLSLGNGTLWQMKFSETMLYPFYEHPPLAIWMESLIHRLLGDSLLSERFYSLIMWLLNGWLILKIWKVIRPSSEISWIPLFLWVTLPIIMWSFSNNMLENTMGVFVSASVFFFLKGRFNKQFYWDVLSGTMLTMAFLSKGFVGLYPLALPVLFLLLFYKERTFFQHLLSGIYMLFGFGLVALPFVMNETSYNFLVTYLDHQVKNSVENIQTVSHRFKILEYFAMQMALPLVFALIVYFIVRKKGPEEKKTNTWSLFFLILSLGGVLPIMISLKQRDFYILTVYPFAIFTLVLFMEKRFEQFHELVSTRLKHPQKWAVSIASLAVIVGVLSTQFYKREKEIVQGVELLSKSPHANQTFDCSNNIRYDWSTMAYLSRYAKISVAHDFDSDYKLVFTNEPSDEPVEEFVALKFLDRLKKSN